MRFRKATTEDRQVIEGLTPREQDTLEIIINLGRPACRHDIADPLGVSIQTVRHWIRALEKKGWLQLVHGDGEGGGANFYWLPARVPASKEPLELFTKVRNCPVCGPGGTVAAGRQTHLGTKYSCSRCGCTFHVDE